MARWTTCLVGGVIAVAGAAPVHAEPAPMTLRQAIAEALASGPALRAPDDGRTLAAIREGQSAARFGLKLTPTVQTGSDALGQSQQMLGVAVTKRLVTGATLQLNATTFQTGTGGGAFRDAGYTFAIAQPLLRGWTDVATADLQQARRGTTAATRSYDAARQGLVVSVADAFYAVVRSRRLVNAAERALDRVRQLRTSSEARSRVGLATELDVLRAELLLSQSEAALVAQRETLESSLDALKTMIGRPSADDLELDDDVAGIEGPQEEPVERAVERALSARLDLREARDRIADARRSQTVARWNLLPPIVLDAQYTRRGIGGATAALAQDPLFNGWRLGISSSYALDRSDEGAAAATAAVSVRAAERDARDVERRVADEVRRAYRAWTRTLTTMTLESKSVELAERQLRLAQLRYERGIAGNFDVVDAENSVFQAQSGLIAAQVERALAGLTLRRVAGDLDPEEFRP